MPPSSPRDSLESSESLESEDSFDIWEGANKLLEEWYKEKMKEAIAKGDIRPRKLSTVRHFPPGCGRGAALVSREECIRIQQAWIKDKMGKSQEIEEDPSMCSDQGDSDPNDT
ncbi:Uncharacterized protein TCM_043850 [Theobroma cacao]|uniref:Uncharacterized protein n=1 Tax=Theobroma cacao TaxID=3641 RepID=A0A061FQD4_THECC|nr:Uncharacterized protein TCM_043850 [Theobroma cacao]